MLLRTRINIGAVAAMVLVGASIGIVGRISLSNAELRATETAATLQRALFQKGIATNLEGFASEFTSLTRNRELRNTLKSGDTAKLPEAMQPTYNRLSTGGVIDHLDISDKTGKIVSSHPEAFAGTTTQANVVGALAENKLVQGLVLNHHGKIVVSSAMPLVSRGKLIGAGIYSKNLDSLLKSFKTNAVMDVFVIDQNGEVASGTAPDLWEQIKSNLKAKDTAFRSVSLIDDVAYEIIAQPIAGMTGDVVGRLVTAKVFTEAYNTQKFIDYSSYGGLTIALIILTFGLSIYLRRNLRPLGIIVEVLEALTQGDREIEVPEVKHQDEIGSITSAVQVFKDNLMRMDALAEREKEEQVLREQTAQRRDGLAKQFENSISGVLTNVSKSVDGLYESSTEMSEMAEKATERTRIVADASTSTSVNVQTVSAAADELSTAISEISQQMGQAQQVSLRAESEANSTNEIIQDLAKVAEKIGSVIALISDIAEQTNLLALNATIEAARAGDAGKGFAVVASEVKSLANQTTKATEDISTQVVSVQNATAEAVKSIGEITDTIGQINHVTTSVAAAVEQQGAATSEIARNIEEAAKSTDSISSNIDDVQNVANRTGTLATGVLNESGQVAAQSEVLQTTIERFLKDFSKP